MGATKKKQSASPLGPAVRRVFSWMFGPGRTAIVLVLLVGLFGGGAWLAWIKLKDRILPAYLIGPEQVEVTPQPPWIQQSDVRAEVFHSSSLDGQLALMDDDLIERISNGFARHPWVSKVEHVTKNYGGVKVELVYRKPVCMVELRGGGLVPVDAEAMLLPIGDFTQTEAAGYPRLLGVDREPPGLAGSRWGDARVIGAAEIAAVLIDLWEPMRLHYMQALAADPTAFVPGGANPQTTPEGSAGRLAEPFFVITTHSGTHSGTRILWGYAPGANALGELPAAEKVARLKRYFAKNDTLDGPQGSQQELDIRKLPPSVGP
jgi:hypothetical protein